MTIFGSALGMPMEEEEESVIVYFIPLISTFLRKYAQCSALPTSQSSESSVQGHFMGKTWTWIDAQLTKLLYDWVESQSKESGVPPTKSGRNFLCDDKEKGKGYFIKALFTIELNLNWPLISWKKHKSNWEL